MPDLNSPAPLEIGALITGLGGGLALFLYVAKRLVASEPNRLAAFQVETDLIENLKRLNTLTRRIARAILEIDVDESLLDETTETNEWSES